MAYWVLGRRMRGISMAMATSLLLAGCATMIPSGLIAQPTIAPVTIQNAALRALPAPTKRIPVAVYDFPDLTGQYNETTNGNNTMSHVVTQGGSALLIKALQDAGERRWFTVLDRARLDDTLKERQIVTEMRRVYRNETTINPAVLPPLAHASIIIQGGITGYDTYTKTGGLGARYLGIGGDTKWQQDTVTINLRAVSTNTSEVLASVTIQKSLASVSVQGSIFQYVALDRILEGEAGMTENEPKEVAVSQAIEKAVTSLIIEGAELGIWQFADRAAGQALIAEYHHEKYGDVVPPTAQFVPPPATPNAAAVVETRPIARPAVWYDPTKAPQQPSAVVVPAPAAPSAPPPPDPNEVLG